LSLLLQRPKENPGLTCSRFKQEFECRLKRAGNKKRGAVAPPKKRTGVASLAFVELRFQLIKARLCLFHLRFQLCAVSQ
jgi:hypothetical protein